MSTTVYKNLEDLTTVYQDGGYMSCRLMDQHDILIIPRNKSKADAATNWKKILTKLKSKTTKDGIYNLYFYTSPVVSDKFEFHKGKITPEMLEQPAPVQMNQNKQVNVLGWEEALRVQNELAQANAKVMILQNEISLKNAKIEELEKQVKDLEKELSEIEYVEDEEEEEKPTLQQPAPVKSDFMQFLEGITPALKGLAGEYFDTQKKKMELWERMYLFKQGYNPYVAPPINQQQPQQQQQQQQQQAPRELTKQEVDIMDAILEQMYTQVPGLKEKMEQWSNASKTIEQTLTMFAQQEPQVYGQFVQNLKNYGTNQGSN